MPQRLPSTPAQLIAGQRRFDAQKRRALKWARRAGGAEKIKAVNDYMLMLGSHERIAALLPLIENESAETFWPIFRKWWPACDCAGGWNWLLAEIFHRVGPAPDPGEFFHSLPDCITVYRGASRERIEGAISWTTNLKVAQHFAHGHRLIRVPDPVIATGVINKLDVFLATNERSESEILALPHIINVEDFQFQAAEAVS
jgi:hypothetical protein